MKITESQLKQIVREEVSEKIILEEISSVIAEMQLALSDEQQTLLEQSVLDALKSASKKTGKPLAVMALLAFGSQVASDLYDLENVGVSPTSAEQISNAVKTSQTMSDARADYLQNAIDASGREGEIPADLAKGVGADDAKDIAMDNLENNFAMNGDIESTGQAQQTADGVQYITYVPYENLPDGYKDTFTRGAEKEDLKIYYQTMEIGDLKDLVVNLNVWGSEGQGNFYDSDTGTQLLPSSWSIAYKALQDKTADRGAKGKNTFQEKSKENT
jgi:hypothetical protein